MTPEEIVKVHQYLYYVLGCPIWSDFRYDMYCKEHGINGCGGSDHKEDYEEKIIKHANLLNELT